MSLPKITVLIPNCQGTTYLERAICSVLDQGYENSELIVIDGDGSAASAEVLQLYRHDLAMALALPGANVPQAIQAGLARISGSFVSILPATNMLLPNALHHVHRQMQGPDGVSWLLGPCPRLDEHDRPLGQLEPQEPSSLASFLMHNSGLLPLSGAFVRTSILQRLGPPDASLPLAWDYEYVCRLLVGGWRPIIHEEALTARRELDTMRSAQATIQRGLQHIEAALLHASALPEARRQGLWENCDHRRRIYALAVAEAGDAQSTKQLWLELLSHPWWLKDQSLRRRLNLTSLPHAA